jgi:cell division protein FtsZ
MPKEDETRVIKVIGVGGAGITIVDKVITSGLAGVDFMAVDYDHEALERSQAPMKIEIKSLYTRASLHEKSPFQISYSIDSHLDEHKELNEKIGYPDAMVIVSCLGKKTGSAVTPYVAEMAKEAGALTVALVARPFESEGGDRQLIANNSIFGLYRETTYCTTFPISPYKKIVERFRYSGRITVIALACDQLMLMRFEHEKDHNLSVYERVDGILTQTLCTIIPFLRLNI